MANWVEFGMHQCIAKVHFVQTSSLHVPSIPDPLQPHNGEGGALQRGGGGVPLLPPGYCLKASCMRPHQ